MTDLPAADEPTAPEPAPEPVVAAEGPAAAPVFDPAAQRADAASAEVEGGSGDQDALAETALETKSALPPPVSVEEMPSAAEPLPAEHPFPAEEPEVDPAPTDAAEPPLEPEAAPEPEPEPEPEPALAEAEPAPRPKRRGWWSLGR